MIALSVSESVLYPPMQVTVRSLKQRQDVGDGPAPVLPATETTTQHLLSLAAVLRGLAAFLASFEQTLSCLVFVERHERHLIRCSRGCSTAVKVSTSENECSRCASPSLISYPHSVFWWGGPAREGLVILLINCLPVSDFSVTRSGFPLPHKVVRRGGSCYLLRFANKHTRFQIFADIYV